MANAIFRAKLVRDGGTLDGLPVACEAGDFDVTRGADTAAANAYNVSAATLQAALEALTSIGAGNVAVAESTHEYHLLDTDGASSGGFTMEANGFALFPAFSHPFTAASIKTAVETGLGSGDTVDVTEVSSGVFLIDYTGIYTGSTTGDPAITNNTTGQSVTAKRLTAVGDINAWILTFQSGLANTDINDLSVTGNVLKYKADTITVTSTQAGVADVAVGITSNAVLTTAVPAESEVQQLAFVSATDTFDVNGNSTSVTIDPATDVDAAAIQAKMDTMWGSGNTAVSGTEPYAITFQGAFADQDIPQMTITNVTDGSPAVTTLTEGATPVHQVNRIVLDGTATAGSMTVDAQSLAYNANASTLTISGATASGTPASGTIDITFTDYSSHDPTTAAAGTLRVLGVAKIFTLRLVDSPTEGTFDIAYDSSTESEIAFDVSAAALQTLVRAWDGGGWTNATVDLTAGVYTVNSVDPIANITITAAEGDTPLRRNTDVVLVEVQAGTELITPSDLAATASSSSAIGLTWTDTNGDETGFEIQRSLGGADDWTTITTTAANATSYSATGLDAETEYDFRIRAVNAGGNGPWSSTATDTTDAAGVASLAAFWFYY